MDQAKNIEVAPFNNNIPLTMSNFFFMLNFVHLKDEKVESITPKPLNELFD